jgi:L,D-transpeptidase catalytic domain
MARTRAVRVTLTLALATAALAAVLLRPAAHDVRAESHGAVVNLGGGPSPAFAPAQPQLLSHGVPVYRWAPLLRPVTVLRVPGGHTPLGALATLTPEGTRNLVLVLGSARRRSAEWVHIRLPILPNNSTGWIPRPVLGGYHFVTTHLVVDRHRLRATLIKDGRTVFTAPIGVGQPQWPTPPGEFYIRDKLTDYASPFYGPVAFGTSARSSVLTDWPDGGFVGIHGTDAPELIPGRVSHGCIRLRNRDILRLAQLMPVGTPLTIE